VCVIARQRSGALSSPAGQTIFRAKGIWRSPLREKAWIILNTAAQAFQNRLPADA
jgi:hypothetical protein